MFGHIASFLGLRRTNHPTQEDSVSGQTDQPHSFICEGYGWCSKPNSAVRLRVSPTDEHVVRIFGYPPQEDYPQSLRYATYLAMPDVYVHYLLCESMANVRYIMGDQWRSQLISDFQDVPGQQIGGFDVILRPSVAADDQHVTMDQSVFIDADIEAEERAHSLRMRRGGAVAVCTENVIKFQDAETVRKLPNHLFDWPASGVWILRAPWLTQQAQTPLRSDEEIMEEQLKVIERSNAYFALVRPFKQLETMRKSVSCWSPMPNLCEN